MSKCGLGLRIDCESTKLHYVIIRFPLYYATTVAATDSGSQQYKKIKITVFWDVTPSSLVEVCRRFRGAYCLHHQVHHIALMMEAASTSELVGKLLADYTV
jgi:hypothetical protein